MIYISFDIGVKNLALCILKKTNKIEILDWRIISIADSKKELKGIDDISERVYYEMDNIVGFIKENGYEKIDYVLKDTYMVKTFGFWRWLSNALVAIYIYWIRVESYELT